MDLLPLTSAQLSTFRFDAGIYSEIDPYRTTAHLPARLDIEARPLGQAQARPSVHDPANLFLSADLFK